MFFYVDLFPVVSHTNQGSVVGEECTMALIHLEFVLYEICTYVGKHRDKKACYAIML
jgi:hypothetical protein